LVKRTGLEGLPGDVVDKLSALGVNNADDLWALIGGDFDAGITKVATQAYIAPQRLINLLTELGKSEPQVEQGSGAERHWLDVVVLVGMLILLVLGLRAFGVFAHYLGLPFGLHETIVARDDLAAGVILAPETITLSWSADAPGAAVSPNQVVGRKTLKAVHKGEVIFLADVDLPAALVPQVVVKAPTGLQAFHVLGPDDLELKETTMEVGAFTALEKVTGRYLLESAPPGTIVRTSQVSTIRLSSDEVTGRQVLTVPVRVETLIPAVGPGSRIALLFARHDTTDARSPSLLLEDVLVMAVYQQSNAAVVVAVDRSDVQQVVAWLGASDIFILQPVP
jgi:flagella basal body P-ring formation protein FlgA